MGAPRVVIFQDGRVFTTTATDGYASTPASAHRHMHGQIPQQQLEELLARAATLPPTQESGVTATDEWPTVVQVGRQQWSVYRHSDGVYREFTMLVEEVVRDVATESWEPSAWLVMHDDPPWTAPPTCEVAVRTDDTPQQAVPVYPHVVDRYPLGPLDCTTI
jgi:hypothetical protein